MEKKMIVRSLVIGGTLLLTASCGKDSNKSGSSQSVAQAARVPEAGVYRAALRSINPKVASNIHGTATIALKADEMYVQLDVNNAPANTMHAQYIHSSENCPTEDNDLNKDGYIDAVEAKSVYGQFLLPLDGELKTQLMESPMFPVSDNRGNYSYREWADTKELMKDLTSGQMAPGMMKLAMSEDLNLGKRSVVIYGVSEGTELPESVKTVPNANRQATFPIACGSIVKISDDVIKY